MGSVEQVEAGGKQGSRVGRKSTEVGEELEARAPSWELCQEYSCGDEADGQDSCRPQDYRYDASC